MRMLRVIVAVAIAVEEVIKMYVYGGICYVDEIRGREREPKSDEEKRMRR